MNHKAEPWYSSWFDSPYYPILYQHRNDAEAELFMRNLHAFLAPPAGTRALDLACGRGRHAAFLHSLGLDVTGLDLSPASIADAQAHAGPGLRFGVQDMRQPFADTYQIILNLFTSFGYFEDIADNSRVLQNIHAALETGGIFVMDFMNSPRILAQLVPEESKTLNGIQFHIRRKLVQGIIVKDIEVQDETGQYPYQEKVQAFHRQELENMAESAGLKAFACWGDYEGNAWSEMESPRCILFFRKTEDFNPETGRFQ